MITRFSPIIKFPPRLLYTHTIFLQHDYLSRPCHSVIPLGLFSFPYLSSTITRHSSLASHSSTQQSIFHYLVLVFSSSPLHTHSIFISMHLPLTIHLLPTQQRLILKTLTFSSSCLFTQVIQAMLGKHAETCSLIFAASCLCGYTDKKERINNTLLPK